MVEESTLIQQIKNGDEHAFEQIVTLYEKKIYNMAYRTCQNGQDAMDITQEVFLRVFRSIKSFKEESSFSTWIYRIATNMCIDFARRSAKNNTISLTVYDEDGNMTDMEIADETYSPEAYFEKEELRREIEKGLMALSPEHRHIIILRDMNGFSYLEIAEILKLEEGTVKSRLARARAKLVSIITNGNFFKENQSNISEGRRNS
ncbi:MAG: sigma-70 family RNA polymerase sigma factor [Clostridiales bacterium]|nr:sigma-70 family RNA polymerase sigma factor [Clostridiales bacterium]